MWLFSPLEFFVYNLFAYCANESDDILCCRVIRNHTSSFMCLTLTEADIPAEGCNAGQREQAVAAGGADRDAA